MLELARPAVCALLLFMLSVASLLLTREFLFPARQICFPRIDFTERNEQAEQRKGEQRGPEQLAIFEPAGSKSHSLRNDREHVVLCRQHCSHCCFHSCPVVSLLNVDPLPFSEQAISSSCLLPLSLSLLLPPPFWLTLECRVNARTLTRCCRAVNCGIVAAAPEKC